MVEVKKAPLIEFGPREEDLYRCVHCGLCLSACPTYMETGLETESPRGRIALMKAVKEGRLGVTPRVASHWEMCLACRACEAVCPSGVPYGRLIEDTRAEVVRQGRLSWRARLAQAIFLRGVLPRPWLLRAGMRALWLYQRLGLQWVVRRSRVLRVMPGGVAEMEEQLPKIPSRFFEPRREVHGAMGEKRMRVGLLSGCVMPLMQSGAMDASVRVLQRNGCEVAVSMGQGCCGALNLHSGDVETARRMARRNIDVFLEAGVEKVVVASAGCGSTMKEYGQLFEGDAEYAERARRLGKMTVDITELLASLPLKGPSREMKVRVTYQDPCHLAHAQRITEVPRQVLRSIPGLELVEMENASRCCGAAGIYSVTQAEMSRRLVERKVEWVRASGAEVVATANPGCMMQLEAGLRRTGSKARVRHVVEVVEEAYGGGES
ncbi:MAG: 4Fe-4S dicluster domain-containing protein [SAR202 cluster bacterium]|nr:4Fe-4S dicluster domain-containing protein [SAR202 cluster bacterium]